MRHFIDVRICCQEGLSLVWDKWKAWQATDHRAIMALRKLEVEHLQKCTICNPTALVDQFFGKPVEVTSEQDPLF